MTIQEYIQQVLAEFTQAEGSEVTGTKLIEFDIGINNAQETVWVDESSTNRIKFTLEVKRG